MTRRTGFILAALTASLASSTASATLVAVDPSVTVQPMGQTDYGYVTPLKKFQNDLTYVAGGRLTEMNCFSDSTLYPTCGTRINHRLAPGYDPNLSTIMLGGFRLSKIAEGSLPQGSTMSIGIELMKIFYDRTTGDFTFAVLVDFGPGKLDKPISFTAEVEYWIVLTSGSAAWTKSIESECNGYGVCKGSNFIVESEVPPTMTFMGSGLQKLAMRVDAKNSDQIREFGFDGSHWYQDSAAVYDPESGNWNREKAWRVEPMCRFIGQNSVWKSFTCETRMVAFAAVDGWYEVNQPAYSTWINDIDWSQTIQLPVPKNGIGVFTALAEFDVGFLDPVQPHGNREIYAGCFKSPLFNPPLGSIVVEGVLSDQIPPRMKYVGDVNCLTGWMRTP